MIQRVSCSGLVKDTPTKSFDLDTYDTNSLGLAIKIWPDKKQTKNIKLCPGKK